MGLQPAGQRLHCLDNYTQQLSSRASSHWPWPAVSSPKTHLQKLHVQDINFSITLLIHGVRGLLLLFGGNQHVMVIIHSKALLIKRCNGERERCQMKQRAAAASRLGWGCWVTALPLPPGWKSSSPTGQKGFCKKLFILIGSKDPFLPSPPAYLFLDMNFLLTNTQMNALPKNSLICLPSGGNKLLKLYYSFAYHFKPFLTYSFLFLF